MTTIIRGLGVAIPDGVLGEIKVCTLPLQSLDGAPAEIWEGGKEGLLAPTATCRWLSYACNIYVSTFVRICVFVSVCVWGE